MTQTFSVNEFNDIYIGEDGNLSLSFGLRAVEQACEQAAKTQLGEMIYQTNQGIPNFQTIWSGGNPNIAQFDAALRVAILAVNGVTGIQSLNISASNNTLSYTAQINTIYGPGTLNNVI